MSTMTEAVESVLASREVAERIAAAREEVREACVRAADRWFASVPPPNQSPVDAIRATPLDATPLADAIRDLRARNEELVAALEAKVPGETRVRDTSVEYGFACGRGYLSVNGIVVAMEGDICRDTTVSQWRTGSPFGGSLVWKCEDFKRIEAEFSAPIRAALSRNRGTR